MTKLYRRLPNSTAPATPRVNVYEEITAGIVRQLEEGVAPWAHPWNAPGGAGFVLPRNAATDRRYSGVNILLLWGAMQERGYSSRYFLTFKQALDLGGSVRKGEKGIKVVFADRFVPKSEKEVAQEEGRDAKAIPFLKSFTVFSVEQCDGLPERFFEKAELKDSHELHRDAEALFRATGARFRIGGNQAYYSPSADSIALPLPTAFPDSLDFYRTAAHELVHWTGAEHRLARKFGKRFGDSAYAREELVAELGAAFTCAHLGIPPSLRHADYLGHWIGVLREDSRAIFQAASLASKACEYLLHFLPEEGPQDGAPEPVEPDPAPASPDPAPIAPQPSPAAPRPVSGAIRWLSAEERKALYSGGRRAVYDGVPMKVHSRRVSREMSAFKAHMRAVLAGEAEWTGDANFPRFSFTPAEKPEKRKGKPADRLAVRASAEVRAYYSTGHRMTFSGVPCRIARKPATKHHAGMLQGSDPFRPYTSPMAIPHKETPEEYEARKAWERRMGFADRMTPLKRRKAA